MNGIGGGLIDGSGTINPAALNTPGKFSPLVERRLQIICTAC